MGLDYIRFRKPDSETSYNNQQTINKEFDLESHDSLGEAVAELRRKYDKEEQRRTSVESKSGSLIGINGLVLSLSQFSEEFLQSLLAEISVLFLLVLSTIVCLWNISPKEYEEPIGLREYVNLSNNTPEEFQSKVYARYFSSTIFNKKYNNFRYTWFTVSFLMSGLSVVLIGIDSIVSTLC